MTDHLMPADRASKWRRRGVVALVTLLVLLVLRVGLNLWFGHELNVEVARLEKAYGPLNLTSMAPPKIPPEENRARVVRAAASLASITQWAKLATFVEAVPGTVNDATRQEVANLVDRNVLALQVAAEVRNRAKSNWEIDYPEANRMPRLVDIRGLSNVLAAAARFDANAGRLDAAAEKTAQGLRVAESLASEPITIMQLLRMGMADDHLRTLKLMLVAGEPSAERMADLAQALSDSRTPDAVRAPLLAELKFEHQMMMRGEGGEDVRDFTGVGLGPRAPDAAEWLFRPVARMAHLHYLRAVGHLIELETTPPFARKQPIALPDPYPRWWQLRARFDSSILLGLHGMAESAYAHLSALNVAELGVALRRYHADHGSYPDSLDQLAPRYLARVPIDPFTGRAPDYRLQGDGFSLTGHGSKYVGWSRQQLFEWKVSR